MVIKIANTKLYILIGMFLTAMTAAIYSAILPAVKNQEWFKTLIIIVLLLAIFYIIKMRFATIPLSIDFNRDKVRIKTLWGTRNYLLSDLNGLEYSGMGRTFPRYFLTFGNGDIYDIISQDSAEKIEDYVQEFIQERKQ